MKPGLLKFNKKYLLKDYFVGSLLQVSDISQIFSLILNIFSEIQILGLTYWIALTSSVETISYQGMSQTLKKIADSITFDYFSSISSDSHEYFTWIGAFLLLLFFTDLLMIVSYVMKKDIAFVRIIWSQFMNFHHSTYFLLVYRLSIQYIKENSQQPNQRFNWYMIMSIIYIIFSIAHAYLASWKSVYPFDSEYSVGLRKNGLMLTGLTLKVIVIPVFLMLDGTSMKWVKSILILVLVFARNLTFLYELPTMNFKVLGLYLLFGVMQLCSCAIGIFALIFHSLGDYFCHLYFVISILSCWIAISLLKHIIKKFAFYNIKEMTHNDYFFTKIASIKYIFSRASIYNEHLDILNDLEYQVLYYSIIKEHNFSCTNIDCGCNLILEKESSIEGKSLSNAEKKVKILEVYETILTETYSEGIIKLKNNFMIKLNLAYLLANGKNKDVISPLMIIYGQKNEKLTLNEKFALEKLTNMLEEQINLKYSSETFINIERFFQYECLKHQFREKIYRNVDTYIELWHSYVSEMFKITSLINKAELINNETILIKKIWHEMRKINESSSTEALEYSGYIATIANAPYSARMIEKHFYKKVLQLNDNKDFENINSDTIDLKNDAFIYFSLKTGKIEHVCFTIDFLGYKPSELIGKNVKDFLLPSLSQTLEKAILDPFLFQEIETLHTTHITCIVNKEKYISRVLVYLAPVPKFTDDILMVCILRECKANENILALNESGIIEGCSKDLSLALNIDPKINIRLKISDICTNYEKINTKTATILSSKKNSDISRSSETFATFDNENHKKTRFSHIINQYNHQTSIHKNDLNLCFKPYKSHGIYIEFLGTIMKLSEAIYCLKLIREEESFKIEGSVKEFESDQSIDKIFEVCEDEQLNIEKTCYQDYSKVGAITLHKVSEDRKQVVIKSRNQQFASDEEKKNSNLTFKGEKQKKILDFMDSNSVSSKLDSSGKEERYYKILEEAIYQKKDIISLKLLNMFIILHTTLSIILLILYITKSNEASDSIPDIIDMITYNQQKIYWTYDNYWNGWLEISISKGLLEQGFGYTARDYYEWLFEFYLTDGQTMLQQNNLILKNLYKFSSKVRDYLTEQFPYVDKYTNQTRYGDFFELESELGNSAISFYADYSTKPYYPPYDNPNLEFIRKNSLNGLLIKSETLFDLLADEGNIKMDLLSNYLVTIIIIILGISLILYIAVFISEYFYRKEKSLFIESFLQIRQDQAKEALEMAQGMKNFLSREGIKTQTSLDFHRHIKKKKNPISHMKKKAANYSGLYTRSYFYLLILFFFQIAIGGILLALYNIYQAQRDQIFTQLEQITQTNKILFKFSSTFLTLYEYINTDGKSLLRYNPLAEEWIKDYNTLVSSYSFFLNLNSQDAKITENIKFILSGDLCLEVFVNGDCSYDIPRQGVLAMNSYVLSAIKQIKEVYDGSDKSDQAKTIVFNLEQFRKVEDVYFYNAIVGYSMIQDLLQKDVYSSLNNLKTQTVNVISTFCVLMIMFTMLFWYPIWKRFVRERNAFGRLMTIIPFNIILKNGFLKAYLISYASNVLSTIKNVL